MGTVPNTITAMFYKQAQKYGDRTCLMHKVAGSYRSISWNEYRNKARKIAKALLSWGIDVQNLDGLTVGDRVAIMSKTCAEWVLVDMGILSAGGVDVPLYDTLTASQAKYIIENSDSKYIFVQDDEQLKKILQVWDKLPELKRIVVFHNQDPSLLKENIHTLEDVYQIGEEADTERLLDDRLPQIEKDDLATIIYTSGTTGPPKGVMLTHHNLMSNVQSVLSVIPLSEDDVALSFLPLSHSLERMAGYYTILSAGATIAYAESMDTIPQNMMEVSPTVMVSVPRLYEKMYARILAGVEAGPPIRKKLFNWAIGAGREYYFSKHYGKPISFSTNLQVKLAEKLVFSKVAKRTGGRLKYFVSGGAPLAKEIAEFFMAAGMYILEGYGLTETSPVTNANTFTHLKFGTVGKSIPGVTVKIAPDGEILVKGPNVMKGYWKNPEATAEVIDKDGWFHTGDIGEIDDEGFLRITDRKKELIVMSNGKNVAPALIENALKNGRFISMAMVIGDNRKFISALVAPDFEQLEAWAKENGIDISDRTLLLHNESVVRMMQEHIDQLTQDFARYEKIKKFTLIDRDFLQDLDELTPTLKLKRRNIMKHFEKEIEAMYSTEKLEEE